MNDDRVYAARFASMNARIRELEEHRDKLVGKVREIGKAFEPVLDWFNGDGERHPYPSLAVMIGEAVAELQRDRSENLKMLARIRELEGQLASVSENEARYRVKPLLSEAQSQAAAMREAIKYMVGCADAGCRHLDADSPAIKMLRAALAPDAGRRVAEVVEAARGFDVLPCVNAATKWSDPPPMDDRWAQAVCRAADLVKRGIVALLDGGEGGAS